MNEEIKLINNFNDYQLIQYLVNGLLSHATGGNFEYYDFTRQKILQRTNLCSLLPDWIKTCKDSKQFLEFIKGFPHYQERREFIWETFNPILNQIESKTFFPLEDIITFDEAHIHEQWTKAIERKSSDPEGAITIARTLIESILKHILSEQNITYSETMDLSELYKEVAKSLNLAPEQHQEPIFKQILGGANGIISGLGTLRNKLGDAHGSNKNKAKPQERHSELAVNMSGSMAIFLYKTFLEHKKQR